MNSLVIHGPFLVVDMAQILREKSLPAAENDTLDVPIQLRCCLHLRALHSSLGTPCTHVGFGRGAVM